MLQVQRVHSNTHVNSHHHPQQHHQQQHQQPIQTQKPKKKPKEQITYYELLELEKQKNEAEVKITIKRSFPIAPDGFIPNSVVRKFFQLLEPGPKQPEKKVWKLKWVFR